MAPSGEAPTGEAPSATPARLMLGVDGGNTKSIALVATADGSVVGAGRVTACADPYAVGLEAAIGVIVSAADEALRQAGAAVAGAAAAGAGARVTAAFSLAGADWPEDFAELGAGLGARWPGAIVVNDGIGALRASIADGPGVVVALGTGAATAARGIDGRTWHSSFWQEPQGAHELGVRALRAVYRAALGIDPPTALTERVLERLGEWSVEEVLHRATRRGPDRWREPKVLASTLLDAAEEGDPAAVRIVEEQGSALGRTAAAAARQVGIAEREFPLALTGGVFRHPGSLLPDAVVRAARESAPGAAPFRPTLEPAAGALLLAFDAAGITVAGAVEERLLATLPPETLYDTR